MDILSVIESRPRSLMDRASDFGSDGCGFESRRGRLLRPCIGYLNRPSVLLKVQELEAALFRVSGAHVSFGTRNVRK
jgi:hypothetical protein